MKRDRLVFPPIRDTPATRRRRLQRRLQEINAQTEREIAALTKSVEKIKSAHQSNNPGQ